MSSIEVVLGLGAIVLLAAVVAVKVSSRLGLPSLLLYLGIGLLLGESVLGIDFDDARLTQALGVSALVLILAEGGLSTRWRAVRPVLGLGVALSTVAVGVSIGVIAAAGHWLLDLDWRTAFIWGAVLSSTDAAAVFSVLRGTKVGARVVGALELEAGMNDAPVFIVVVLLAAESVPLTWWTPLLIGYQLVVGAAVGVLLGAVGAWLLRRSALPATGLYPLATVTMCVLAFACGQLAFASGLLAAYAAGLVLGNSRLPHRSATLSFVEGLGWLSQIGLFVLLGLYASPGRLPAVLLPALAIGAVVLLVARPLSVLVTAAPFRVPWREQVFISWAGLRGAVPIVLALIPFSEGIDGSGRLVNTVFVLVFVLTLLQGSTLSLAARWLGLDRPAQPSEVEVDAAPLDELGADLLHVRIGPGSRMHGVYLAELRLPAGATVSLVVRDGVAFTPAITTRLRSGDQLLVVCTVQVREQVEQRIRAVHRAGRLARWLGETGHG